MNKIFKSLLIMCILMAFCVIIPGDVQAKKLTMEDTDSKITLKYDDRHTFKKEIKSITTISVTSDNVKTGSKDTNVLKMAEDDRKKVIATGCGKAVVELENGKVIGVTVKAAKISLLLLIGQSNMEGTWNKQGSLYDYQNEYIVNKQGKVYSTYGPSTPNHSLDNGCFSTVSPKLSIWNPEEFVPDSLTDNSSPKEWKRTNNLTDAAKATGKTGLDGALAKEWVKKTGGKVWIVNASHSGSAISTWLPGSGKKNNNFWQAVSLYKECEMLLNNEIEAGHYKLSHKGYFWLQGEANSKMTATKYMNKFMKMHNGLKKELGDGRGSKFKNVNKQLEFAGILMVRAHGNPVDVSDLYMTGPRKAQYYMCNSSKDKFKDIFLASHIAEEWVTDIGVDTYFKSEYASNEKYLAANNMKKQDVTMPSKVIDVHQTIHYTQLGYNEIGKDAAANICYALGYAKAPQADTQISLVGGDGYTDLSSAVKSQDDDMSLTVKVFPAYKAKQLKVMRTEGIALDKWNVKFQSENYFSGRVKYMAGGKSRIYTLYSKKGESSIQSLMRVPGGIKVDWKKINKASYYKLFRRAAGEAKWVCIKTTKKNSSISYTDYEAQEGTGYEYMVRAFDKYGIKGKNAVSYIAAYTGYGSM